MSSIRTFMFIAGAVLFLGIACMQSVPAQPLAPMEPRDVTPVPPPTRNPDGIVEEKGVESFQMLGCPDKSGPVHYIAGSDMFGLSFGCDGNGAWFQTGKNSKIDLLLYTDGTTLFWKYPGNLGCINSFGAEKPSGEVLLSEQFPNGYIPLGTGVVCTKNDIVYQAIFYMDVHFK